MFIGSTLFIFYFEILWSNKLIYQFSESSQSAFPDEPAASPTAHHLSQDEHKELDQTTGNTDTPLNQDPVESQSSTQYNKCDSPVPEITNGRDNESDWSVLLFLIDAEWLPTNCSE